MDNIKKENRPWGNFITLNETKEFKIKNIVVYPGSRLSLQRHKRRSEHWYIINGEGEVTIDDRQKKVAQGDSVNIPAGSLHRMESTGKEDLSFIEVQTGEYFGEDDIERVEDDYGRLN